MTKTEFRKRVKSLKPEINKLIDRKIETFLSAGCTDLDKYESDYRLAKIFMSAMGEVIKDQYKPLFNNKADQEEIKNISLFI